MNPKNESLLQQTFRLVIRTQLRPLWHTRDDKTPAGYKPLKPFMLHLSFVLFCLENCHLRLNLLYWAHLLLLRAIQGSCWVENSLLGVIEQLRDVLQVFSRALKGRKKGGGGGGHRCENTFGKATQSKTPWHILKQPPTQTDRFNRDSMENNTEAHFIHIECYFKLPFTTDVIILT